jgi:xanthine phosphoribosyltransferase
MVSTEFLGPGDRVLVIDDFLATGATISALVRLIRHAEAELVGIGTVIEKSFEGGREDLEGFGVPIVSLAVVSDMSNGQISLV